MNVQVDAIRTRRPTGSATVEAAVVLPFMVMLALGTTDLGRFCYAYVSIATAARNGANYGSTSLSCASNAEGIRDAAVKGPAVEEWETVPGWSVSNPTVTSNPETVGPGHSLVKVTVSFRFNTIIPYPGLPQVLTMTRTVYMRVLPS